MTEKINPQLMRRAARHLRRCDPLLGALIQKVGPCRIEVRGDPYRELIRAIVYQQLAGAAAGAILGRLKRRFQGRIPKPDTLLATDAAYLRSDGLSRQKIAAVYAVAEAFANGSLSNRRLYRMDAASVVAAVTEVKGIGEWTAHMLLMFSLGRPDILPVGDYGVRQGARILYDLEDLPDRKTLQTLTERWRPYRSIGSWYLWRATEQ
ncbi:MAG: DNA-3-methyladenine glycosylase 2 family protein [Myxococcota bacterium]